MALSSADTSIEALRFLCGLVNSEMEGGLSPYQFSVDGFEIQGGTVITVTMPLPSQVPEAHMIAIATNAALARAIDSKEEGTIDMLFLSLEFAEPHSGYPRTMVGRWDHLGRENYGVGLTPTLNSFVECVERIWVSEIWRKKR